MVEIKKDFEKLIEQVGNEINKFNNALDELPEIDGYYSDLIDDIKKETKTSKKERRKIALNLLKEKCPKFIELMNQIDLLSEGMKNRIEETRDKLEGVESELEEIEELQEEIEQRKNDLDI